MREVVPKLLWIGNVMDVDDLSPIFDAGIEALVDLALNEKPAQLTRELIYGRFPLNDGSGNPLRLLRAAVDIHDIAGLVAMIYNSPFPICQV